MTDTPASPRKKRRMLWVVLLSVLVLVVVVAAVIVVPILTHQSAGGSGQEVPEGYVATTSATGADGRTRTLEVQNPDGTPADLAQVRPGQEIVVLGQGFDSGIGIYVGICIAPDDPAVRPSPCLGGVPEDATEEKSPDQKEILPLPSVWITDNWAWQPFATQGYADSAAGSFRARILVPQASQEGLDCTVTACAITTRADHTAIGDRVQDMQLPVAFGN